MAKKVSPRFTTQEGAMTKPTGKTDNTCRPLTAREIAANKRNRKKGK